MSRIKKYHANRFTSLGDRIFLLIIEFISKNKLLFLFEKAVIIQL